MVVGLGISVDVAVILGLLVAVGLAVAVASGSSSSGSSSSGSSSSGSSTAVAVSFGSGIFSTTVSVRVMGTALLEIAIGSSPTIASGACLLLGPNCATTSTPTTRAVALNATKSTKKDTSRCQAEPLLCCRQSSSAKPNAIAIPTIYKGIFLLLDVMWATSQIIERFAPGNKAHKY